MPNSATMLNIYFLTPILPCMFFFLIQGVCHKICHTTSPPQLPNKFAKTVLHLVQISQTRNRKVQLRVELGYQNTEESNFAVS